MADIFTNWSPEEFKAYVLLYCSNADFVMSNSERNLIQSKIDRKSYKSIRKEFDGDDEALRYQKIRTTAEIFRNSEQSTRSLIAEIKDLFISDGSYNKLERDLLTKLKILLR